MSAIQEKITALAPDAAYKEGQYPTFTVPSDKLREVARMLKDDPEMAFDYLTSLTGVDEGPEIGLGVVYHLTSSVHNHWVVLKTFTTDRENPVLPTVSDIWGTAELNEREVYDYFGVKFAGHQDMRRLYLRRDFVGYPLRKDYDMNANKELKLHVEEGEDDTVGYQVEADGTLKAVPHTIFSKEEYVVNIGPQHPATHGVLHFRVSLDGEIIRKIDPNCGYIHRGIEKLSESKTYPQTLAFTDRLDYLSAHMNRHALCNCIEKALGIEVSDRVKYIRTIMDELQRIDSHLLFYATLCMDFGALTAFFYGFRDREKILDIFEATTGGRLIQNYYTIGGVQADLHPDFVKEVKKFIKYLPTVLPDYHDVFTGNIIAQNRMKGIGILSKETAISYGVSGPSGRASGWACDVRKTVRQGGFQTGDLPRRRRIRPLHGAHGRDQRVAPHHRTAHRQHSGGRHPGQDQTGDQVAGRRVLLPRGGCARRFRGVHRIPWGQVSLPPEIPLDRSSADFGSRSDHPRIQDRRPDRHRSIVGLRRSGHRPLTQ